MKRIVTGLAVFAVLSLSGLSHPVMANPQPAFSTNIERDAKAVGRQLRCVVCQNQSIEDSDAPLAADMRLLVRKRLAAGDSKVDVIALMRERYGDYVLLMPPVQSNTLILWLGPVLLFFGGVFWWFGLARREKSASSSNPLSDDENAAFSGLRVIEE